MKNYLLLFFLIALISACNTKQDNEEKFSDMDTVKTKVFRVDSGWGYDIYINSKIFIHQPLIPAVQGRFVFRTADDARKTAAFVVQKLLKNEGLPAVTVEELDSLGVLYDEVLEYQIEQKDK